MAAAKRRDWNKHVRLHKRKGFSFVVPVRLGCPPAYHSPFLPFRLRLKLVKSKVSLTRFLPVYVSQRSAFSEKLHLLV